MGLSSIIKSIKSINLSIGIIPVSPTFEIEYKMFISEFVTAATEIQDRSLFWNIWHMLYTPILSIKEGRYKDKIIEEYLLAGEYQNVRQWYDLKDNLWLYENIAKDLGNTPIISPSLEFLRFSINGRSRFSIGTSSLVKI